MKKRNRLQEVFQLPLPESGECTWFEKICIFLLAISPLLQHYRSFFQNGSTVVLILLFVYFGTRLLCTGKWCIGVILPLIVFSAYETLNHGVSLKEVAREALLMGYFIAGASGVINKRLFTRTAVWIAMAASVLIVMQYICYYVLGFHLQLVTTSLLEDGAQQWVQLAETGRISVSGNVMKLYRPSAFFLEPSHLTIYCFPALALVVFSPEFDRCFMPTAILLSMGIVLSTSGMGIVLVGGIWGIYLMKRLTGTGSFLERVKKLNNPKSLMYIGGALLVLLLVYLFVPVVRMSVNRIFVGSNGGKSAIMGRMGTGIQKIYEMQGWEFWFGMKQWGEVADWNMSGLFYTMYTQGIVGAVLSYGFYVLCLLRLKNARFWIAAILIGLSLVTVHTHAAFFMLYFVLILLEGFDSERDWLIWNNFFCDKTNKLADWFRNRLSVGMLTRKGKRNPESDS